MCDLCVCVCVCVFFNGIVCACAHGPISVSVCMRMQAWACACVAHSALTTTIKESIPRVFMASKFNSTIFLHISQCTALHHCPAFKM